MNGYRSSNNIHQGNMNTHHVVDVESDTDSDSPEFDGSSDDGVLKPSTHDLGLSKRYAPQWTPQDAFREFYQNWKDAILNSFSLDARSFHPTLEETSTQIQIRVYKSTATANGKVNSDLCGFILFNKRAGSVELTNFRATLDLDHLSLGGTSKRGNDKFAGQHGEGFKLAALVVRRKGHSVRIAATSYYWNFNFRRGASSRFYCQLTETKPEKVNKQKNDFARKLARPGFKRDLTANVWEDVTVKIAKARDEFGYAIQEDEFRSWLHITLDIISPSPAQVVNTGDGDLILDPRFAHTIFLKGLRVVGNGETYALGYNFAHGKINRDRDCIADVKQARQAIVNIWQTAISIKGSLLVDIYLEHLKANRNCTDVKWICDNMTLPTVETIWCHMKALSSGTFYFYVDESASNESTAEQVIRSELKKQPALLPGKLFKQLRKFSLISTPDEESRRLFKTSLIVPTNTDFGHNILRALSASLSTSEKFREIRVVFVEGGGADRDFIFDRERQHILIHQKWLSFQKIHDEYPCEIQRLPPKEQPDPTAFFCDHVVEDLLDEILPDLADLFDLNAAERRNHRRLSRNGLRSMPRLVQTTQSSQARTLEVSWVGHENGLFSEKHSKDIQYFLILHKESSCAARREDTVHWASKNFPGPHSKFVKRETSQHQPAHSCRCPSQVVSRAVSKAQFDNLDPDERYFPMIARAESPSFFGMPPLSIAPRNSQATIPRSPEQCTSVASSSRTSRQKRHRRSAPHPPTRVVAHSPSEPDSQLSTEKNQAALCEQDEADWRQWFKDGLSTSIGKLAARDSNLDVQLEHSRAELICENLNFCFKKGEFARIRLSDDQLSEHPVLVHNIFYNGHEPRPDTTYLLVTMYTTLQSTILVQHRGITSNIHTPEITKDLLLRFADFDKMGLQDDAELVRLDEIAHASELFQDAGIGLDYIKHVREIPKDHRENPLLCRFAIRRTNNTTEACLTPVASHLLSRPDRWKQVTFPIASQPAILDFTPNILGPSEGFAQAGFSVTAGIGFDPQRHITWKVRHRSSYVYDGLANRVLQDVDDGLLAPPHDPLHAAAPKVAVIAGGNAPFHLNDQNESMPSLVDFVDFLDKADNAIRSALRLIFWSC